MQAYIMHSKMCRHRLAAGLHVSASPSASAQSRPRECAVSALRVRSLGPASADSRPSEFGASLPHVHPTGCGIRRECVDEQVHRCSQKSPVGVSCR